MISPFIFIIPVIILLPLILIGALGITMFHLFLFLIFTVLTYFGFFFFLGVDILAHIYIFFKETIDSIKQQEEMDKKILEGPPPSSSVPEIKIAEQVFNIPSNQYTYKDSKALCSAYGARLATYSEVENAYNKGAEWCNYGWSENQQILFPTQKETYDKLQGIKGHENDCGRQGVNGGYIANPDARFGVNCFGYKPEITTVEQQMMENATSPYPLNAEDLAMQKRVEYFKKHLNTIMISPFNSSYWSKLL